MVEELLLRGYALKVLDETWGRYGAVGATSIVFSLLHVANPAITILALINVFLAGVILALLYLRSGSLWLAVGFHWGWNFIEGAVLGCAVSGIPAPGSILTTTAAGPPWLSGGPFGPEGSVVLTITASLAALLLILAKKSGPARVAAVSAE